MASENPAARDAIADAHAAHAADRRAAAAALAVSAAAILRAVVALNGAAAVATLVFMMAMKAVAPGLFLGLVLPLSCFGFGLTVSAFATGFSHFAGSHRLRALESQHLAAEPPAVRDNAASHAAWRRARLFDTAGLVAVLVAMAAAVVGFGLAALVLVAIVS